MTIDDMMTLFIVWCAGLWLGGFFFGGLWWTIRRSLLSRRPALWLFSSLLLRMSVTLAALYAVITSGPLKGLWVTLLLFLLGFVMARILIMRLTRPTPATTPQRAGGEHHAP